MVSMELPTERSSVGPARMPQRAAVNAADVVVWKAEVEAIGSRRGIPLMQVGSMGALVTLGLLGGSHSAQAAVRRGANCEAVDQLQVALDDRGYDVGVVDGQFGWRTEAAVRRFQQQQNLLADGVVGPATAKAMGLPPEFSCASVVSQAAFESESPSPQGNFSVATNGGALRLRKAPAGAVVGALKNGTPVTVIETANGWAKLHSGAWVSRAWLQLGRGVRARNSTIHNRSLEAATPSPSQFAQSVPIAVIPAPLSRAESSAADNDSAINAGHNSQFTKVNPTQTRLETALPGQIIQLPSPASVAQLNAKVAAAEAQVIEVQTSEAPPATSKTIEAQTTEVKPTEGKVLPPRAAAPTSPLQSRPVSLKAAAQIAVHPAPAAAREAPGEVKPLREETAFIQTMSKPGAVSPASRPVAVLADTTLSLANAASSSRQTVSPHPGNSRALLAATTVSNSLDLPSAIAPESTPLTPSQRVIDPARSSTVLTSRELANEISGETVPQIAESAMAAESMAAESTTVATRSANQLMEVATYGDRLLIRDRPSGKVIGSIPNGLQINTIAKKDGWYELETGGWVMARWLRG